MFGIYVSVPAPNIHAGFFFPSVTRVDASDLPSMLSSIGSDGGENQSTDGPPTKRRRIESGSSSHVDPRKGKPKETPPPVVGANDMPTLGPSALPGPASQFCMIPQSDNIFLPHPCLLPPPRVHRTTPDIPTHSVEEAFILHPVHDIYFLSFPAYDHLPDSSDFGCHHETVLTACMIVTFNRPGYLSTSRDRNDERIPLTVDYLRPRKYYYHIDDHQSNNYPLCQYFKDWKFPHKQIPPSWITKPTIIPDQLQEWESAHRAHCGVQERDKVCVISGSPEYLTVAHIVPEAEETWLRLNEMEQYLGNNSERHLSRHNAILMQGGLHMYGYDLQQFVIVPKSGKLVVHFLRVTPESANIYHNMVFGFEDVIPREIHYARFAWSLIKTIKANKLGTVGFNVDPNEALAASGSGSGSGSGGQGRGAGRGGRPGAGGGRGHKRGKGGDDAPYKPSHSGSGRKKCNDVQEFDSFFTNILNEVAPGDPQSIEADAQEIRDDLEDEGNSFYVNPEIPPPVDRYDNAQWYPGIGVVERRKKAYINRHPQIRECSQSLFQSNSAAYHSDSS